MKYVGKALVLSAVIYALCASCASGPETVTTVEKATDVALIENIEERVVHTFNDPREEARIEGHAWVWPEDAQSLVKKNESRISFSQSADSPDGSTYLIWNVDIVYDRERFPTENADIGQRLHFNYSPLLAFIPEYNADGIFLEAKASERMPTRVQLNGRDISGGVSVTFPTEWQKIYLPFSAFKVHYHNEDRQEAGIHSENLFRFWDVGIEQNLHELRKTVLSGTGAGGRVDVAVSINTIGLYRVEGTLPEHIVEYFDSPIPHLSFENAAPEIFSGDEQERNRTDIIVNTETMAEKILSGGGAEDTRGYFTMQTKFEISDKVKELSEDSGIGFMGRFYGDIDMSAYSTLGFFVRARGVERIGIGLENHRIRTAVHREVKIEEENEWTRVEVPFYSFQYDDRIPLNQQNLQEFFKGISEIRFSLSLAATSGWRAEKGDRGRYVGQYDLQIDLDNFELIGEMPAFTEFMTDMKEFREEK